MPICDFKHVERKMLKEYTFIFFFFNYQIIYLNKLDHFMSITTLSPYYSKKKKIKCRKMVVNINTNEQSNLRKVSIHSLKQQK